MLQDYEINNYTFKSNRRTGKLVLIVEFILVLFLIQSALMLFTGKVEQEESFRFRILAHSNTSDDQQLKLAIQQEIEPLINNAISQSASKAEIVDNLDAIEDIIIHIAKTIADGQEVTLERKAALFPPKRSGLFITPQAPYDAYILTIGSGRGDNWWCSLFPRVCFPDKEVETVKEAEEEKVTFFVWEWIKSWFA
ncbi:stage II sporulation protein R [Sporosarcina thermotolerans]|uniref:Stage II sporulation protein R n=1 Tax=Sporosarcina thermotolerans TaxID=633404 RepID=A0AAW9A619_9BACL|nr:stage II sporulation protein R [Sporosarcina thermotolerans]MDW0116394.1 stage II sporulation protein R [Sporosarcina thermotolerans]WHT48351.1 stage II sporulation protein R [Sporosarcina thermotolerans]